MLSKHRRLLAPIVIATTAIAVAVGANSGAHTPSVSSASLASQSTQVDPAGDATQAIRSVSAGLGEDSPTDVVAVGTKLSLALGVIHKGIEGGSDPDVVIAVASGSFSAPEGALRPGTSSEAYSPAPGTHLVVISDAKSGDVLVVGVVVKPPTVEDLSSVGKILTAG